MKTKIWKSSSPPGPRPMPLVGARGNLGWLFRNPAAYLMQLYRDYGPIVSLAADTRDVIFTFTPDHYQSVLLDIERFHNLDSDSSPVRLSADTALARLFQGLLYMNGVKHARQRRLMLPAFHKRRVSHYRDAIVALTEKTAADWQIGDRRDLFDEMRTLTLLIAIQTLLGLDPFREGQAIRSLLREWVELVFSVAVLLFPFDWPGFPYRRLLRRSDLLETHIREMIVRKRNQSEAGGDVLSMLLQARDEGGKRLTDDELLGQVNTLFVAGHEITARALTWTLFLLDQHPQIEADLRDELDGALRGEAPTVHQLDELPLLEAVIKESLRLVPPVIWWCRIATEAFGIGPYAFDAGTHVVFSAHVTHHDEEIYADPEAFDPERWFSIRPVAGAYIPFSWGPRRCLGASFAMMEMKLILAVLLQRYRFSLQPGSRIDHRGPLLSSPKQGLPMMLHTLDHSCARSSVSGSIRTWVHLP